MVTGEEFGFARWAGGRLHQTLKGPKTSYSRTLQGSGPLETHRRPHPRVVRRGKAERPRRGHKTAATSSNGRCSSPPDREAEDNGPESSVTPGPFFLTAVPPSPTAISSKRYRQAPSTSPASQTSGQCRGRHELVDGNHCRPTLPSCWRMNWATLGSVGIHTLRETGLFLSSPPVAESRHPWYSSTPRCHPSPAPACGPPDRPRNWAVGTM